MKQVQTQLYMQLKLALQIWLTVCNLLVRLSSGWVTWPSRVTSVTSITLAHRPSKGHRGLDVEDQRRSMALTQIYLWTESIGVI